MRIFPRHRGFLRGSLLCLGAFFLASFLGCSGAQSGAEPAQAASESGSNSELQVTYLMGHLSTYTNKAGWATQAENGPLATFYLDKIDQVMAELTGVDRWEGIPLGSMAKATMSGSLQALRSSVAGGDWTAARETYRGMTLACNSCHAATRREYVVVTPVSAPEPPGQRFGAP